MRRAHKHVSMHVLATRTCDILVRQHTGGTALQQHCACLAIPFDGLCRGVQRMSGSDERGGGGEYITCPGRASVVLPRMHAHNIHVLPCMCTATCTQLECAGSCTHWIIAASHACALAS